MSWSDPRRCDRRPREVDVEPEVLVCVECQAPTPVEAGELVDSIPKTNRRRRVRMLIELAANWRCADCLTKAGA